MAVRPELPALTGLRGIAAGLIVLTHYTRWCAPFDYHTLPQTFERFCGALGETAMTLFFTLSGFVIVYNYLDFPWRRRARVRAPRRGRCGSQERLADRRSFWPGSISIGCSRALRLFHSSANRCPT